MIEMVLHLVVLGRAEEVAVLVLGCTQRLANGCLLSAAAWEQGRNDGYTYIFKKIYQHKKYS